MLNLIKEGKEKNDMETWDKRKGIVIGLDGLILLEFLYALTTYFGSQNINHATYAMIMAFTFSFILRMVISKRTQFQF